LKKLKKANYPKG